MIEQIVQGIAVSNTLGHAITVENIEFDFTANNIDQTKTFDHTIQGNNIFVKSIHVEVYRSGTRVKLDSDTLDLITVNMFGGNRDIPFSNQPVSIYTLNEIGKNPNFKGFIFKDGEVIKMSFMHYHQNWTTGDTKVILSFAGMRAKDLNLLQGFANVVNDNLVEG